MRTYKSIEIAEKRLSKDSLTAKIIKNKLYGGVKSTSFDFEDNEKRNDLVPDTTLWAWPCSKKNKDVISAERCKNSQNDSCRKCIYKKIGKDFIHVYGDRDDVSKRGTEIKEGDIFCKFTKSRHAQRILKKCPRKFRVSTSECDVKELLYVNGRKAAICRYEF